MIEPTLEAGASAARVGALSVSEVAPCAGGLEAGPAGSSSKTSGGGGALFCEGGGPVCADAAAGAPVGFGGGWLWKRQASPSELPHQRGSWVVWLRVRPSGAAEPLVQRGVAGHRPPAPPCHKTHPASVVPRLPPAWRHAKLV